MNSMISLLLLAQATGAPPVAPEKPSGFGPEFFIAIIIFMVAFYFLIQRPGKKAEAEKLKMVETMQKGDPVVSIGGIHGVVSKVLKEKGTILVQVAKGVEIEFNKAAISPYKAEPEPTKAGGGKS